MCDVHDDRIKIDWCHLFYLMSLSLCHSYISLSMLLHDWMSFQFFLNLSPNESNIVQELIICALHHIIQMLFELNNVLFLSNATHWSHYIKLNRGHVMFHNLHYTTSSWNTSPENIFPSWKKKEKHILICEMQCNKFTFIEFDSYRFGMASSCCCYCHSEKWGSMTL